MRVAATHDEGARFVRTLVTEQIITPLAHGLGSDHPELRAALAGSQIVGMVMARHVVGLPALAELDPPAVAALLAPGLQRALTGPLFDDDQFDDDLLDGDRFGDDLLDGDRAADTALPT
jgi:hypothetical protein